MANTIKLKKSSVAAKVPLTTDLEYGELAINYTDGNLFFKTAGNAVATIASTQFVSVTGNVTGNYFIGNGSLLTGISGSSGITWTTVANTAPASPSPGDFWYDSYAQVKYQYTNTGTGNVWIDQSVPTSFANITVSGQSNLNIVSASGNITGSNIFTSGVVSATGNVTGGNVHTVGQISANGVTLGITTGAISGASLSVSGNVTGGHLSVTTGTVTLGNVINSNANGVGNIGSSANYFNTVFAKATSAQYADLAEIYAADLQYPPGTVVIFGGIAEVTQSTNCKDSRVAGVVSTDPAFLMNTAANGVMVALIGRVPCYVQGPVQKGDLLVTGTQPGTAKRLSGRWIPGCVLGKCLDNIVDHQIKLIEIVVGRL